MACKLDYQRADNMWAAEGRPDGNLGTETISLNRGQKRIFNTDWKYEKQRNDGTNYYGSHLRIAHNDGSGTLHVSVRYGPGSTQIKQLLPGVRWSTKCDLMEVECMT